MRELSPREHTVVLSPARSVVLSPARSARRSHPALPSLPPGRTAWFTCNLLGTWQVLHPFYKKVQLQSRQRG